MNLNKEQLFDLLTEKEIYYLYHANTVATTITFIQQGGLVSRGYVERNRLTQTPQPSDDVDKLYDVFEDVFLDTADLHIYFGRQNYYGPILFKLKMDILLSNEMDVWMTKDNPINWSSNMTHEQKYFQSVEEIRESWNQYARQRKMVTIRKPGRPLFFDDIESIIVDDPRVRNSQNNIVYFNSAVEALKQAYRGNENLRNKFRTRECNNCWCRSNYRYQVSIDRLNQLFLPI